MYGMIGSVLIVVLSYNMLHESLVVDHFPSKGNGLEELLSSIRFPLDPL